MLRKLKNLFSKINSIFTRTPLDKLADVVKTALPYVRLFAELTPTRSDDEFIRLFSMYGLPAVDRWLAFPPQERGVGLAWGLAKLLEKQWPGMPTRVIRLAVETAYNLYREEKSKEGDNHNE